MRIVSRRPADWTAHALSAAGPLAPEDLRRLERLMGPPERHSAGAWLQEQGDRAAATHLIVSGWAAQARVLSDGRRQIARILLPGDIAGLGRTDGAPQIGVVALTEVVVADVGAVREAAEAGRDPAFARGWAALRVTEQSAAMAHIMRLGRFTAYERTGHLLLELYERLSAAGLTLGDRIPVPLTQETLADCLGLSVVHLNRMIQQLRRNRLITTESRKVGFLDLARLAEVCHYPLPPAAPRAHYV
jgi:CRP-like cAMP-binding protein